MKLTLLLSMLTFFQLLATESYSQLTKLTLKLEDVKISDALKEIENESEFFFLYNPKLIDAERKVNIDVENAPIKDILSDVFKENVKFVVYDRQIILLSNEQSEVLSSLQQKGITGTVSDKNGAPVAGANVVVSGTSVGTITDINGKYSIEVPQGSKSLRFSFVGMESQEISIGLLTQIDATMVESGIGLEEVVVIGYGSQKKVNLTGAVSQINFENKAIASRPLTNVSTALVGLSSGMFVIQGDGTPSADGATINIRGTGSLNASQNPLVLIDGQPGNMDLINPTDVESVSVLKDAASCAIYGSRGSNGVILITTKSGKDTGGKISLNYTGTTGFAEPTKLFDVISNTADDMEMINMIQNNSGLPSLYTQQRIDEWRVRSQTDPILYPNTNWWDAVLQPGIIQNHNLSARGGNEKIGFYTSLGYLNNTGIIDNTGYERFTFRNNLTYKINDWLKLGSNITALFGNHDAANADVIFQYWDATSPSMLPRHPDGRYGGAMSGGGEAQSNNIVKIIETSLGESFDQQYTGKLFATLNPVKGLEINGSYFTDFFNNDGWASTRPENNWDFQTETIIGIDVTTLPLAVSSFYAKRRRTVTDLFANYTLSIGRHKVVTLLGYNQEYYKQNNFNATKKYLYSLDIPVLDAATKEPQASGTASDFAMRSYFGRVNYDFAGKYLLEANFRYDGSSKFSPDNRWGFFPSFSAGWRISEEAFWSSLEDKINSLKLRASWGQLGNNGIGNYEWQSVYSANNHSFNGSIVQGLSPYAIANSAITWETTDVLNVGTDFTLFKKVSVTLDYYNKYTHGILASIPIPFVNGGLTAPTVNSAEIRNSGIEAYISYDTKIRDLTINLSLNGSYNKNEIVKYKDNYIEPHGVGAWTEGVPVGTYWVREIDHIVQDKSEIDALISEGWTFNPSTPGPGDFLYKDVNNDKIIDDNDRVLKGNPIPKFTYGSTLNFGYKGFDLYAVFNGVSGWDKYLSGSLFANQLRVDGRLYAIDKLNSWTPENKSTTMPKVYINDAKNDMQSDYFLKSANYLRLKSLQLGYTIPSKLTKMVNIGNLRVYVNLENYFTFTSYPGMDPENDGSAYNGSITYPLMKTISFGLNLTF